MSGADDSRVERDSMGEVRVPAAALYGAQTQRAVENFRISGLVMPRAFIRALGLIKGCAASVNGALGELDPNLAEAIDAAAGEVAAGKHDGEFPIDVFQTGSGTSSNMNANEVIANLAGARLGLQVHPNDAVNRGQSSNDVIPTAIHVSAALMVAEKLTPCLGHLISTLNDKADAVGAVVKTGRTHLMDAMPVTFAQEIGGWAAQLNAARSGIESTSKHLLELAQGGTAVGTGINAHPDFASRFCTELSDRTGLAFRPSSNRFAAIAGQETAVALSGQLRVLAVALMKIANDLRWMNSGPLNGLAEIKLPALQPGSSIMPGKVNPVIPESVTQVCAQVMGNDLCVAIAAQSGNFQLNVMLPVIAYNLLQSIELLSNGMGALADKAIAGFTVEEATIRARLDRNPILVTALNEVIGYEKGAEIAKRAYREGRSVRELAAEMTDLSEDTLASLLDPATLTNPKGRS